MELKYKVLEHPFYKAWSMGEITMEQLSQYHKSYAEFISCMPQFWNTIAKGFGVDNKEIQDIIQDETNHIELWNDWAGKLTGTESFPSMLEIISEFKRMTPSELLGAVHAFEIQQPEVAVTKKEGLIKHYGFNNTETRYFDEHINEAEHIDFGLNLKENYANSVEFEKGFARGSELIYNGLDLFLN